MGHLYEWLGLTTGIVTKGVKPADRRAQYEADITYVENSELGFDYLRDNLTKTIDERVLVWRPLGYAIIDEVDSILIDEARTPLIISQPGQEPTEKYEMYAKLVTVLTPSKGKKKISKGFLNELLKDVKGEEEEVDDTGDYYIDEKSKTVTLSSAGIERLE
jgi:preprotein translocase subunit SecA